MIVLQLGLFLIALSANFLSALSGGGAGLVQLPALILLGLPFSQALATHKVASVALGLGASIKYIHSSQLKSQLISFITICGLPGVYLGSNYVLSLPEKSSTLFLSFLTLLLGFLSASNPELGNAKKDLKLTPLKNIVGGIILFGIGFLNGSLSSGTGLFVTMWLVGWFGLSYTSAVAHTLVLVGIIWNGTGALTLGINSHIAWTWIPSLIAGSLIGGYIGAHVSIMKGDKIVKKAFEYLALLMGASLFLKGLYM